MVWPKSLHLLQQVEFVTRLAADSPKLPSNVQLLGGAKALQWQNNTLENPSLFRLIDLQMLLSQVIESAAI